MPNVIIVCRFDDLSRFVTKDLYVHLNPRRGRRVLFSSQSRYDHFDTSPYLSQHQYLRKRGELMGRTSKNIKLRTPEKPRKIKGFRSGSYRVATTISSQPRYDHFDTAANAALQINLLTAQLLYQKGRWQSMLTRGFAAVVCQAYARGSTYSKIHR